ncbi:toll/interleukin-1 receptor domain-containing protein [Agrococcus sp. DT81.2]|uniref:toll/interleukin-1 receptor domain-containing protein n=1 Tax=Agrococcus sp. DT81.2 TaxID=3393414 RepID=UPI003CE4510B
MGLSAGDRINYIRECSALLGLEDWDAVDLVLDQHGLPTADDWGANASKSSYVTAMIRTAPDHLLQDLHSYLTRTSGQLRIGASPYKSDRLRVFMSHLTAQRDLVGDVGRILEGFGVDGFVAHDSIEPSKEWQDVIEAGLADCDALVVFLHDGFLESRWCDQEVGWVMGRARPVLPLAFDAMPHGFLSKYQASKCAGMSTAQVGQLVVRWLAQQPTLQPRLAVGLTEQFVDSSSWNRTRALAAVMETVTGFTDDQLEAMTKAAESNVDVRDCLIGGDRGPEWVASFIAKHRAPAPSLRDGATWEA